MARLLVVEDDENLNKSVCAYLVRSGYEVTGCASGDEALDCMDRARYDLIVSDIMMPGTDGFALAEAVRLTDRRIPILFMSARDDLPAKRKGFGLGIDDYLVKPFDLSELGMRVGALLRRVDAERSKRLTAGNLVMDAEEHAAYVDGEELPLTVREFDLLFKLLSFPKKTFTRAQLMEEFWDYDSPAGARTVDVYIVKLREKTAKCTGFEIVTRHGLGYKAVLR